MAEIGPALRAVVRSRANGLCEYCLISERYSFAEHQIDHIIALKHGGWTEEDNLALCCGLCNRYKGSDLTSIDPETGKLARLFHPRRDGWMNHYQLRDDRIIPLTDVARVTVTLLQLNHPRRIRERNALRQGNG